MEGNDGPNAEQLIDHAWMVDLALLFGRRSDAADVAERLFDDLVLHDGAFELHRHYLERDVAEALASSALSLRAGVARLVEELRLGTSWPRPSLRSAVEALILEEAAAVGDCAPAYVD